MYVNFSLTVHSYNMVGQFKFCLTIIGGFILFKDPISPLQFLGISITFSGMYNVSLIYKLFKEQFHLHPVHCKQGSSQVMDLDCRIINDQIQLFILVIHWH